MHIESYHGNRAALLPLFQLADDSAAQIASYIALGDVLVAKDRGEVIGHIQIIVADEPGTLEIKSMAVLEDRQAKGIGSALVEATVTYCRNRKVKRLIVSTAAAATGTLRFYQRQGFRMYRVVQDAFGPAQGYPEGLMLDGIPLRDQVWLELEL